jgi:hypothetical protein
MSGQGDIDRLESQYDWLKELVGEGAEFESVKRELLSRDAQIDRLEREASGQVSRIQKLLEQVEGTTSWKGMYFELHDAMCLCDRNAGEADDWPKDHCPLHGSEENRPAGLRQTIARLEEDLTSANMTGQRIEKNRAYAALMAHVRLGLYQSARIRLRDTRDLNAHREWVISELNAENNLLRDRLQALGDEDFVQVLTMTTAGDQT